MKSFLQELAETVYKEYKHSLGSVTLVFPNRRASLYFRKYLSALLDRPVFSPKLITIEDLISGFSPLTIPDKLELIHRMHAVYTEVTTTSFGSTSYETFDQFYFWGDMLLRDFEEVDKYVINARYLFKDLSQQKELDASFDFMTEEQSEFLRSFWQNFDEHDSVNKRKFLYLWKQLPEVYEAFRKHLESNGFAYEGMVQRSVAEKIRSGEIPLPATPMLFVGFNALTIGVVLLLWWWVDAGAAKVYWDIDAYYTNNFTQEAGRFFREYQQHPVLGHTFPDDIPSNFLKHVKETASGKEGVIHVYGASQSVGQAKLAAQVLQEELTKGSIPEETVVVLPDEKLLVPVLHSISGAVEKLNVTMGFPLSATPLFNIIELLVELQITRKEGEFNHRPVLSLLGHPYVVAADAATAKSKSKEILTHSWVSIPKSFLATIVPLHRLIFEELTAVPSQHLPQTLIGYLRDILHELGSLKTLTDIDKEYCFHFLKLLNRMEEVLGHRNVPDPSAAHDPKAEKDALRAFLRLFRQLIRAEKIPFRGEPLRGLQVMGVLETRNLDFKNVFILSLNEGAFPSFGSKGSYIPHNIRRAYGLPTMDYQDAIYAYLFYRVLQRAENVFLFYNTETDVLGQGEMSRYLQQLLYEAGVSNKKFILHNPMRPALATPITIAKDERVFRALERFKTSTPDRKYLSPTTLNDYIECRLKFYFKHVAGIREAKEVEEDLDARILGNFLHKVMELFYVSVLHRKGTRLIEAADLDGYEKKIDGLIDQVIKDTYRLDPEKPVVYEGQRLVVKEVVKRFIEEIMRKDKAYTPFEMIALETRDLTYAIRLKVPGNPEVQLGGSIDRADQKNNVIRVIDYKTGKDTTDIKGSVSDLVNRDADRNKAAFQTMLYALLFHKNARPYEQPMKLIPGLMNRVNLFEDNFTFGLKIGKDYVQDATPLLPEFEENLTRLVEELYDPAVPFDQTTDANICKWCPYQEICCR